MNDGVLPHAVVASVDQMIGHLNGKDASALIFLMCQRYIYHHTSKLNTPEGPKDPGTIMLTSSEQGVVIYADQIHCVEVITAYRKMIAELGDQAYGHTERPR